MDLPSWKLLGKKKGMRDYEAIRKPSLIGQKPF